MTAINPYAPPREPIAPARARKRKVRGEPSFEGERRSWPFVLTMQIVTLGLYEWVWLWRRAPFLNALESDKKINAVVPMLLFALELVAFVVSVGGVETRPFTTPLAIVVLVLRFRVARILRSHFAYSGRALVVSGLYTFVFGVMYLQHTINRGADTEPVLLRKKKKKKKRKKPAETTEQRSSRSSA